MGPPVKGSCWRRSCRTAGRAGKPPPAVVDDNPYLGVRKKTGNLGILGHQLEVSWIDLDDRQAFHCWMIRDDLGPGSRSRVRS